MRAVTKSSAALSAVVFLLAATWASAASVLVDLSQYATGHRSSGTGLGVATSAGSGWNIAGVKLSWSITSSGGLYTYTYTWSKLDGSALQGTPSHMLVEVSPTYTAANTHSSTPNVAQVTSPTTFVSQAGLNQQPNPFLPANLFGIKLDYGSNSYTLVTDRVPVWGDVYAKDGTAGSTGSGPNKVINAAWNVGFGSDPTAGGPFTNWVPTPDTLTDPVVLVPLPAAAWMGMSLLGTVGAVGYLRKRRYLA